MRYTAKDLSIEEKITLLTGKDRWRTEDLNGKIPQVFMSDGPSGLRKMNDDDSTVKATSMPTIGALANSWSRDLFKLDSGVIADECIENNVDILLAPGVNIKRTPLNGRNFEYVAEDPYLAGELAAYYVNGLQEKGIGASLKHFCANNREFDRLFQSHDIDTRTLHEIYMKAFEICIKKSHPYTVMCSYNPVNGIYTSENKKVLDGYLRKEMGFDGVIVSDWDAVHSAYKAHKASLDLEMPHTNWSYENIMTAYKNGYITEQEIDECADRILTLIYKAQDDKKIRKVQTTKEQRHSLAVEIAKECVVMLKNDNRALPLNLNDKLKVNVVGRLARFPSMGGGGSSEVQTDFVVEGFDKTLAALAQNYEVTYFEAVNPMNHGSAYKTKQALIETYESDCTIMFVGTDKTIECEGYDRKSIRLSVEQELLIKRIGETANKLIVVLESGSAIDVSEWIDYADAVLYTGFAGEGINEALASIIVGQTNPSGKLTETFPVSLENTYTGSDIGNCFSEWYSDGLFVGYRYYMHQPESAQYSFGYGLSYADFEYSNLKIEKIDETTYDISYDIKNTSSFDGAEISQVYVRDVFSMVQRPIAELKQFSKDFIKAGETKTIKVRLDKDAFAYYNVNLEEYYVENGWFEIIVASACDDWKLLGKIKIQLPDNEQQSKM